MRILTVSAFYESHGGGIEIVAGATARALARRGHECRWAAAAFDQLPVDPLIEAIPLAASDPLERWTGLPLPLLSSAARHVLEQEVSRADAVVIHDALYLSSLLSAKRALRDRKPWILVQHIGTVPYKSALLRLIMTTANQFVTKPLLTRASQAVFISDAVRADFAGSRWKSPPALLLNGVDHKLFRLPRGRERAELRHRLGMSGAPRQLLFVGRLVEKKGLPVIRELASANPDYDISLVGSGPIDPVQWNLPNVRLLGRKDRSQVAELYRAADALVLPSVGEGFPLVVQEAMASGLPVFCGLDTGAADPNARDLLHAIEVDPSNPAATAARFARAINSVAAGPDPLLAAHARSSYDWDANAAWLERRLSELCRCQAAGEAPGGPDYNAFTT
jgi:glycosyltransferase involved in cell wall biosynthesis